jgi:hypothetical protein
VGESGAQPNAKEKNNGQPQKPAVFKGRPFPTLVEFLMGILQFGAKYCPKTEKV